MRALALLLALPLLACDKGGEAPKPENQTPPPPPPMETPKPPEHEWAKPPADVAAAPADAAKTESGLASKVLKEGTADGASPTAEDTVEVHYTGWTTDGKMFDSSRERGQPARFPLKGVIPGWTEGLQLMKEGESRRLWIPESLAYGGRPGFPAGMLVFDVELLKVHKAPPPIPAPEDVAAAPKDAK